MGLSGWQFLQGERESVLLLNFTQTIMWYMQHISGVSVNCFVVAMYRTGRDSVAMHSDSDVNDVQADVEVCLFD